MLFSSYGEFLFRPCPYLRPAILNGDNMFFSHEDTEPIIEVSHMGKEFPRSLTALRSGDEYFFGKSS
ncbi:hypothetical protein BgiBS90_029940 [Biomphalaria glabrata]|nr:hypothetical protein BgiBS90_029940 [Biomphalaria glabrata]